MKHRIDPKIDCVFKALLGAEINRDLLIHFLNAVLVEELPEQIIEVEILNPHNEREFIDDKLSIIDVKARDDKERMYQRGRRIRRRSITRLDEYFGGHYVGSQPCPQGAAIAVTGW